MRKLQLVQLMVISILLQLVFFAGTGLASDAKNVMVEDIQVERMSFADRENAWLVVSCLVKNMTDQAGNVTVVIRTIDKWAYDRKPLYLSGFLEAGEERRLSVQQVMDAKMFEGLRKYEVKSVEMH